MPGVLNLFPNVNITNITSGINISFLESLNYESVHENDAEGLKQYRSISAIYVLLENKNL
jgi:hypothetical protein